MAEDWETSDRAREARERRPEIRLVTRMLPRFLAVYRAAGRDAAALGAPFGLPADAHARAEVDAPLEALRVIPEQVAAELQRPFLGIELATSLPPAAFGLAELSLRVAPTLQEGLARLARVGSLLNPAERYELQHVGDFAELSHRVSGTRRALGRQINELQVVWWVRVVRESLGQPWAPREVCLSHAAEGDPGRLRKALGCEAVHFSMGMNALRFSGRALAWPLASADPELLALVDERAARLLGRGQPDELLARLREQIKQDLPQGRPTLQTVAAALGASMRTLQRRLDAQNTNFNALLEEVSLQLAKEYLANPRFSAKEVAFMVGYADLSTFIRAFKRATGQTPVEFREGLEPGRGA